MKNITKLFFAAAFLTAGMASAQTGGVGVGTTTPDASSALDVTSTTKGFLMPRMTTAQRTAITAPAAGLQVYDTTTNSQWYYNGTAWVQGGTTAASSKWTNDATNTRVALTNLSNGTTARPAGTEFVITDAGNIGIGTATPTTQLQIVDNTLNDYSSQLELYSEGEGKRSVLSTTSFKASNVSNFIFQTNYVDVNSPGTSGPSLFMANYRGTGSSPSTFTNSPLLAGEGLGTIWFRGSNSGGYSNAANINVNTPDGNSVNISMGTKSLNSVGGIIRTLNITSDERVGIGTTSPATKLDVQGAIRIGNIGAEIPSAGMIKYDANQLFYHNGTNWVNTSDSKWTNNPSSQLIQMSSLSDGVTARTNYNQFVIKDDGKVGIGTLNPSSILNVVTYTSNSTTSLRLGAAGGIGQYNRLEFGAGAQTSISYDLGFITTVRTGGSFASDMIFSTNSGSNQNACTEKLIIKSDGNIGIGTTSPTEKLQVAGAIKIGETSAASPTAGTIRFNTATSKFEGYNGTAWVAFH